MSIKTYRPARAIFSTIAACAFSALLAGPAAAQDATAFYKDKTVKIIVGFGAGGGYDAYARMLAPYFRDALGATVIVENQPGAGGLSALNRLYTAPPDGLQMMLIQGTGAAMQQLLEQPAVRFDLARFGYLGIVTSSPWIWLVKPTSTLASPTDAMKAGSPIVWSASGIIDGLGDGAAITCHALQLNCKIIRGYAGSSAAALSLAQGETDAMYVSDTSAAQYVKAGDAKAIANMNRTRSRFFKDLPTIFETVQLSKEQEWWFDFRATLDNLGRILLVPPGLPKERLEHLQAVAKKVLNDPRLLAEGEKSGRYIDFVDADTSRKMVLSVISDTTAEQKKQVRDVILKP